MEAVLPLSNGADVARPAWSLQWLTPRRCRWIFVLALLIGFLSHLDYLLRDCPIDLSGDEAHYWDWSRRLDLSYYSKGPLVAYLIHASCAVFGQTMIAVRLPALVLALGTSVLTYGLGYKLFGSERIALGAVLLNMLAPLLVAGSVLMTIDPPLFFCWAMATYLAVGAIRDGRRWAWIGVGVAVGVGFLAKYSMALWLLQLLLFLLVDRDSRRHLRSVWPWLACGIVALFTLPVLVWNARHQWVSLHHVASDTGADELAKISPLGLLEFIGGQAGGIGPMLFAILIGAVVHALRDRSPNDPHRRAVLFLACMGVPFFLIVMLTALHSRAQVNWPAPAYFSLMILAAHFLATRLESLEKWKPWRGCVWGSIILAVIFIPLTHHTQLLYPLVEKYGDRLNGWFGIRLQIRKIDSTWRLRGWKELGQYLSNQLQNMPPGAFVLCDEYQTTAETAFYTAGQPITFYAGSYFSCPKRFSQYDLWPDRALDQPEKLGLLGRDAVYVGRINQDIFAAFERVEPLPELDIQDGDLKIRTFQAWRCSGFKGMHRPNTGGSY